MHDSNFKNQESELLNVSGNEKHAVYSYRKQINKNKSKNMYVLFSTLENYSLTGSMG